MSLIKIPLIAEGVDVRVIDASATGGSIQSSYSPRFVELASGSYAGTAVTHLDINVEDITGIVVDVNLTEVDYSGYIEIYGQMFNKNEVITSSARGRFRVGAKATCDSETLIDSGSGTKSKPISGGGYCMLPMARDGFVAPYHTIDLKLSSGTAGNFDYVIYGCVNSFVPAQAVIPYSYMREAANGPTIGSTVYAYQ